MTDPIYDRCGIVTHEEAFAILARFCHSHFDGRLGDTAREKARISIPADPTRDDDLRMHAYIARARRIEDAARALGGHPAHGDARTWEALEQALGVAGIAHGERTDADGCVLPSHARAMHVEVQAMAIRRLIAKGAELCRNRAVGMIDPATRWSESEGRNVFQWGPERLTDDDFDTIAREVLP